MIEVTKDQYTPEWFNARLGIPTASCLGDVIARLQNGMSAAARSHYMADLIVERLTKKPTFVFQTKAMQTGTMLEPEARDRYEQETFNKVVQTGFCMHDSLKFGASPDGLIGDNAIIEIKCPERRAHLNYWMLGLYECPAIYKAQIQGELLVTGRNEAHFVSYNPDFPPHMQLIIRTVARDDTYIAYLAKEISQFNDEIDETMAMIGAISMYGSTKESAENEGKGKADTG